MIQDTTMKSSKAFLRAKLKQLKEKRTGGYPKSNRSKTTSQRKLRNYSKKTKMQNYRKNLNNSNGRLCNYNHYGQRYR